jgi:hypothetical protein
MRKICPDCKHYVIGSYNPFGIDTPRSCSLGKNDEQAKWWEDNGHKHRDEETTQMECFEETEFATLTNKLSGSLTEILNVLKKNGR